VTTMQTPVQICYMRGTTWLQAPAMEGEFSVKDDIAVVSPVLEAAFDKKID